MQDGGGGALRGTAAPAGSCASGLRDQRPRASGATGGDRRRRVRGGPDGGGRPRGRDPGELGALGAAGGQADGRGASKWQGPGLSGPGSPPGDRP